MKSHDSQNTRVFFWMFSYDVVTFPLTVEKLLFLVEKQFKGDNRETKLNICCLQTVIVRVPTADVVLFCCIYTLKPF